MPYSEKGRGPKHYSLSILGVLDFSQFSHTMKRTPPSCVSGAETEDESGRSLALGHTGSKCLQTWIPSTQSQAEDPVSSSRKPPEPSAERLMFQSDPGNFIVEINCF